MSSLWIIEFTILFATLTFLLYKYSTRKYDYFKKRNVYYVKPIPFFGSMFPVSTMKTTVGEWLRDLYNSIDKPYFGIFVFDDPYIIVKSPELIKSILVKDFNKFTDRTILAPKHNQIVSNMMFIQKSPDWKRIRSKMTPVFTSGKLKGMFPLINEVGFELNKYVRKNLGKLESKELSAKFSTDVIAKCAFAINAHSFDLENAEFRLIGKSFFDFTWRNGLIQTAYFFKPGWADFLRLEFFEKWAFTSLKNIFWNTIKNREGINTKNNDLIDILVEIRKNDKLSKELNFDGDKALALAMTFFSAGFETTSSTIAFTLYELCLQPQIQERLRKEIKDNIKQHNGITYEGLQEMKYLEMCIYETLRKYPVLPFLDRRCNEDYKLPGTDFVIEKGMPVYIPMMGLHYDDHYFPKPEIYDPERFSDKNTFNQKGLYFIPFGEGPRICIGERFGMLGVKVGLSHILSEFVLERIPETPVPIKFEPRSFFRDLYKSIDEPYFGIFIFDDPYVIIKSPELVKHVLVKDFNKFSDRNILAPKHNELVSSIMPMQKGTEWKRIRSKMTPVFSSGKLKLMFPLINDVGLELKKYVKENLGKIESKELCAKFSTDVVAKCAFAINANSFQKEKAEFLQIGKALFDFTMRNGLAQAAYFLKPNWANFFHLEFFDKSVVTVLKEIFWNAIRKREQSSIKGNDLIDTLVDIMKNKELCRELNFDETKALAQAITFFAGGYETTSSIISFTLYELCLQPEIQERLREEIKDNIKQHNGITYDGLHEMKYLEMCIFETLRKYPVLPFLDRKCNEDYRLPGTDFVIEEGMPILVPMIGLHYDEQYFPKPEIYDPERFSGKNAVNEKGLCYLPFGEGPRNCIGERFGMLGVKVGLTYILSEFLLERLPETPVPIKFSPKGVLPQSIGGLPIGFRKLQASPA
ncbi:hypothetical protein NQ315_008060 [Exocentrus adspersus]|uniref:Cytochrome P450 n=1 Tax=Exocentrus adspersus TaxID=1586481 RepID=A0AAV8VWS6_9CUCU|nr:hypothetical protein NQ315_008060 [Exocentrus adspersus]